MSLSGHVHHFAHLLAYMILSFLLMGPEAGVMECVLCVVCCTMLGIHSVHGQPILT